MSAVLAAPRKSLEFSPSFDASRLAIDREGIMFHNLDQDVVEITIVVRNEGEWPSPPTQALIQAASLGAFVPWRPLTSVAVPPVLPGQSHLLRLRARTTKTVALGDPSRLPPRRLLTALANDDDRRQAGLPSDVLSLLSQNNPHWAGNLNIFVGDKAVERHMAQALRVYPGRLNMAMFVVGSALDAYRFALEGEAAEWDATLFDMSTARSFRVDGQEPVRLSEWIETAGMRMMMLALCPPRGCARGEVQVHVEQRSTGQEAIVEFSLDATAAGPGCYVVK